MRRDKAIKYYKLAKYQADLFSKDPNTKVGAIFLAPESLQILSMGFNGFARGIDETKCSRWERPQKYDYIVHAEQNGICNACRHGTPLEHSIAVITLFPCKECAKALIQVGVDTIVTKRPDFDSVRWGRDFTLSTEMFAEIGIELIMLDDSDTDTLTSNQCSASQ